MLIFGLPPSDPAPEFEPGLNLGSNPPPPVPCSRCRPPAAAPCTRAIRRSGCRTAPPGPRAPGRADGQHRGRELRLREPLEPQPEDQHHHGGHRGSEGRQPRIKPSLTFRVFMSSCFIWNASFRNDSGSCRPDNTTFALPDESSAFLQPMIRETIQIHCRQVEDNPSNPKATQGQSRLYETFGGSGKPSDESHLKVWGV